MTRFAIYANPDRDPDYRVSGKLKEMIRALGAEAVQDARDYPGCDLLICLGGDGSFLSTLRIEEAKDLPRVGVNLGSCGFLTEIDPARMEEAVLQLLRGDYVIEHRMMLGLELYNQSGASVLSDFALNDVVLMRGSGGRIITSDLTISGSFVERIPGDGVIVCSPTGSTAYSLAAGGPIVHPCMELLLITPICPHSLHNRSYLAPAEAKIELRLDASSPGAAVIADGRHVATLETGHLHIFRAERKFPLIRLGGDTFYRTLPDKIQKRGIIK